MAVRLSALRARHPQEYSRYSFQLQAESTPRAIVRLEGLGKLKKIHLIGNKTRDFPACSIVLPCVPLVIGIKPEIKHWGRGSNIFFTKDLKVCAGLALSIGPYWVGFTWRRRQYPVSETLCFEI
jgi:hypothetical protein